MIKSNSFIDNSCFLFQNSLKNELEKSRNIMNLNENSSFQKIFVNKKLFGNKIQAKKKKTIETNTTNTSTSREKTPIKIPSFSSFILKSPTYSSKKIKKDCYLTPKRKKSITQYSKIKSFNIIKRNSIIHPSNTYNNDDKKEKKFFHKLKERSNNINSINKILEFVKKKKGFELSFTSPIQNNKKSKSSSDEKNYFKTDMRNICEKIKLDENKLKEKENELLISSDLYLDSRNYNFESDKETKTFFKDKIKTPNEKLNLFDLNHLMKLSYNITMNDKGLNSQKKTFSNFPSVNDKKMFYKTSKEKSFISHNNNQFTNLKKNNNNQKSNININRNLIKKPSSKKKKDRKSNEKNNEEKNNKIQTHQIKILRNKTELKKINNPLYFPNKLNISNNKSVHVNLNKNFTGNIDNYIIGKELGKGSFASVKLGIHKQTKKKYAIKIYPKSNLYDLEKRNSVKNEILNLKQLNHENIMKLYEVIDTPKNLYLVLEYINGISLMEYLKNKPEIRIEEPKCKELFYQIVKAINYCQLKNIYHRDIKLENILIMDEKFVKIIDFGFSVKCANNVYQKFLCGTPNYMPPEIINKNKYIPKYSDLWSLGILLYIMLIGTFPFKAKTEEFLAKKINKGEFDLPNFISVDAKNLIKKILVFEPKNRLSTEEILIDKWFEF